MIRVLRDVVRAVAASATLAAAGTVLADTGHALVDRLSPRTPNWNHIRVLARDLGTPRTVIIGASPRRSAAVVDFDADGVADIAFGVATGRYVTIFRGDGSGHFGPMLPTPRNALPTVDAVTEMAGITYRTRSSALSSTTSVWAGAANDAPDARRGGGLAVAADFDDDGRVDVATAAAGSRKLALRIGRARGPAKVVRRVALGAAPAALASGDFDADGLIDLAVANRRSTMVALLLGGGKGGFRNRRQVDAGIQAAGGGLASGDLDGDGVGDLVVAGDRGEVSILLGDGSGGLVPSARFAVDIPDEDDGSIASSQSAAYEGIASLTLNPTTITGGSGGTSTGTITLNAPAPAGGVLVALTSSNLELAASVPSITVPAGATTATFTIGTNRNYRRYSGLGFTATISATHGATTRSATLNVTAQPRPGPLSSFDVHNEGPTCFGVGVRTTGSGITLEFGSAGNLFDCRPPPNPVGQDGTCTFLQECSLGCELRPVQNGFRFNDRCAQAGPFPVAVNPKLVTGGNQSLATLRLNAPAPAAQGTSSGGRLSSLTVLANTIPEIVTPIPAGATSLNADVLTARVNAPQFAPIDGSYVVPRPDGSRSGRIGLTWLALTSGTPPPYALTAMSLEPPTVTGGNSSFVTVQLNQVAPDPQIDTVTATVTSSNPAVASIDRPAVTFTQGSSRTTSSITTQPVTADTVVTISATVGSSTRTVQLTVRATPTATHARSFFLDPLEVTGGSPSIGTVVLDGAAPAGGAVVTLQSANTAVASMPPNVTIPAGANSASFTVTTSPVATSTTVTLSATYGNGSAFTTLTVLAAPASAALASVGVSPASVVGGGGATGTVTLTAPAPGGGAQVMLSSSNPSVASVPASVTVAAGATSATFAVATTAVTASTSAIITATYAGASRTATLTVTPAPSGPLPAPSLQSPANDARFSPGQAITFDWSDVTGAASYTIQIDDSETFPAPLIVSQTVAASQYTNSTLPTRRMWWRVRANDGAGNPGAWSAVRRFEVKE